MKKCRHKIGNRKLILCSSFTWYAPGGTASEIYYCPKCDVYRYNCDDKILTREEAIDLDKSWKEKNKQIEYLDFYYYSVRGI